MNKNFKRILAGILSVTLLLGSVEFSSIVNNKFIAATINDKSLEKFMDEVSSLYEEDALSSMAPDITFSKESENTVVVDNTIMVPVEILTENTDISYSDIKEDIVEQDNEELVAVEDVAKNTDYEAIKNDDESITLSKIYQSKTLIVKSPVQIDTYDAENVISGYGNLYILKYATEEDTKNAYDKFLKNKNIDSVEIDSLVSAETLESLIEEITEESVEETTEISTEETTEESSEGITETSETTESSEDTSTSEETMETLSETENSEELSSESTEETTTEQEAETINIPDGVIVAVLDSGIDVNNKLFDGRIVDLGLNLSTSGEGIQDDNGHGTAVASIIAKNSDAYLMPIKIANSDGKGTVLSLYLAIQAAIENEADIINVSLTTLSSDLLTSIIHEAIEKGIIIIAAAGNQSANVENYAPANIEDVIAVSAIDQDYKPASYSNYGSMIDYTAIGTDVEVDTLNGTEKMRGTSLSAAYVSAVMAYTMENDKSFSDYVYTVNDASDYYGKGIVSLEEIDLSENESMNIEGFDFKIKQSLINEADRDNYKIEIITNAEVEYTFDGGETWQKFNSIEINRNEEFYDETEYMSSIRTLGIKDKNGNTKYKDFSVIDCNNPKDPASQEIDLAAAGMTETSTTTGIGYYDTNADSTVTYILTRFIYDISNKTATLTSIDNSNTSTGRKSITLTSTVYVNYNGTKTTLTVNAIGDGTSAISMSLWGSTKGETYYTVTQVVIPNTIESINPNAFKNKTSITLVTFTATSKCTTIGDYAFYGCTELANIKDGSSNRFPASVKTIGKQAFANTALTLVDFHVVVSVGEEAFSGCTNLNTVYISSTMESIGIDAFKGAPLATEIRYWAIDLKEHNNVFVGKEAAKITFQSTVTKIPAGIFKDCSNVTSLEINNACTEIGASAFEGCSKLTTVTFTATSTCASIGDYAFKDCNALANIKDGTANYTLPASLQTIGQYAFYDCDGLTNLTYGSNLYSIGDCAFKDCSALYEFSDGTEGGCVHLAEQIVSIGDYAFSDTQVYNIRILNMKTGGLVQSTQNIRCFEGSVAEQIAKDCNSYIVHIENADTPILINSTSGNATANDLPVFSGIGRYKFNYTGASNRYYENNSKVSTNGYSLLDMNNLEYSHGSTYKANSSGAKLSLDEGSFVEKAYLVLEYNSDSAANYKKASTWYTTLSYNSVRETTNFKPQSSIEFLPEKLMYYNGCENSTAYIDITDFVKENGSGYYYCSNIPSIDANSGDKSTAWKLVIIEKNADYQLKAVTLTFCFDRIQSGSEDGWKYSKLLTKTLPTGITTMSSSQGYFDLLYGISNSDTTSGANRIQYKIGSGSYVTNPDVIYNGYYIRSSKIPCRLVFTKNGEPIEQIRNAPADNYLDLSSCTSSATSTKYTTTVNEFPVTGDDAELITNIPIAGGESSFSARVGANAKVLILNTLGIAADIEGVNYDSTQTTTVNSATSVTVTGKCINTTEVANVGISDGDYVVTLDDGLIAIDAGALVYTGNASMVYMGTVKDNGHTVVFRNIDTTTNGTYISYTIKCSTDNSGKTVFNNSAEYSGYYYNNEHVADYIEQVSVASSSAIPKYKLVVIPNDGTWNNSASNSEFELSYGEKKAIDLPQRTGYKFSGWTLSGNGSNMTSLINSSTFTMGNANATLTANWTVNTYIVNYDGNGATGGSTASQSCNYGENVTLNQNGYTKTGYVFTGWNTQPDGNGIFYQPGDAYQVSGNITLYAQWELEKIDIPVTITWVDKDNEYASRPSKVTLRLMNGTKVVKEAEINKGDNSSPASTNVWNYKFEDVDIYDSNGKEIQYTVVEGAYEKDGTFVADTVSSSNGAVEYKIPVYGGDNSGLTIVNELNTKPFKPEDPTKDYGVTVSGIVTWKDENDKYHFRPDSVIVELYQDGKLYDSIELAEGTTDYKFTGLPMMDSNLKKYTYTIKEKDIDNYAITYKSDSKTTTVEDDFGNTVTTTAYTVDITNTFTPDKETERFSDNQLTMQATFLNESGNLATESDFKKVKLDKEYVNTTIVLKQLNLSWEPVNAEEGKYLETYSGYSGNEINLILHGTDKTYANFIPYGKYEIAVQNDNNFTIKDIEELATKNAEFSYENGKYYVTYSYEYEEAKEDLNVNMTLKSWRGYTSKMGINNFFKNSD